MLTGGSLDDWAKNPEYVLEATRLFQLYADAIVD